MPFQPMRTKTAETVYKGHRILAHYYRTGKTWKVADYTVGRDVFGTKRAAKAYIDRMKSKTRHPKRKKSKFRFHGTGW